MEDKNPTTDKASELKGVYQIPKEDFTAFWKRLTPKQRNQYIAMLVDRILVDKDYLENPPKKILSRDEWISNLQQVSEIVLKLKS